MKKWKSKKGLTLVELVVTVAILGIVSSMGVGIVANSINNYSRASVVSQEQQTALDVEKFILEGSRRAVGTETMTPALGSMTIPQAGTAAVYIYFANGHLYTVSSYIDDPDSEPVVIRDVYNGVKDISFRFRKHKLTRENADGERVFLYLDYTIEMERGYVLKGTTWMGNVEAETTMSIIDDAKFYDANPEVVLLSTTGEATQAFVMKQYVKTEE